MTEYIIQPRMNTAAGAADNNRVLAMGERGFETDTRRWKTGDGETNYNDLLYDDDPDVLLRSASVSGKTVLTGTPTQARTALEAGALGSEVFKAESQDDGLVVLGAAKVGTNGYNPMDSGNPLANAIGDGNDHPLSERFDTLAEAQAVFPFAQDLAEQIDESAFTRGLTLADVVLAPAGVYKLRLGLAWQTGKRLIGPAVFEPAAEATGTAMFRANNITDWTVAGPTFDAGGVMATSVRIHGGSADFLMEDVTVTGATDVGTNVADCARGTFRRVRSVGNGNGGTSDANWWILGTDHRFIDCDGDSALGAGWRILGTSSTSARNRFTGCRANNNSRYGFYGVGTRADAPVDYVFTDCDAVGNGSAGVFSGFALHMLNRVRGKGLWAANNTEHGLVLQDLYGAQVEVSGSGNGRELVRLQADFGVAEDALSGARFCEVVATAEGNGVGAFTQRGPVSIEGSCHDIRVHLTAIGNAGVPVRIPTHVGYADPYNIEISGGVFSGNAGGNDPVNEGSGLWWGSNLVNGARKSVSGTDTLTETLTNRTLAAPKINTIYDTANNKVVCDFTRNNSATAVNYAYIKNAATGGYPAIGAWGSDTNVGFDILTKGTGPLRVNGVTVATRLTNTAALDFGSIAAQSHVDLTVTATGAVAGDCVSLGVPTASVTAGVVYSAWVSAADTVTVRANNYTAGALDPASGSFKVAILR